MAGTSWLSLNLKQYKIYLNAKTYVYDHFVIFLCLVNLKDKNKNYNLIFKEQNNTASPYLIENNRSE